MARKHEPVRMSRARAAALVRAARYGIAVLAVMQDRDAARAEEAVQLVAERYLPAVEPDARGGAHPPRMFIHPEERTSP